MGTRFNKRCYVRKKTKGCLSIQIYIFVPTKSVYILSSSLMFQTACCSDKLITGVISIQVEFNLETNDFLCLNISKASILHSVLHNLHLH